MYYIFQWTIDVLPLQPVLMIMYVTVMAVSAGHAPTYLDFMLYAAR